MIALTERVGRDELDLDKTGRVPRADWMRSILTSHMERAYGRVRQERDNLVVNMDGIQVQVKAEFDPLDRLSGTPQLHVSTGMGGRISPTSIISIGPTRAIDLMNPADLKEYEALIKRRLDDAISRSLNNMY